MQPQVIKSVFMGAAALFGVVIFMTLLGAIGTVFGASDAFYCGTYCLIGKALLFLVIIAITVQTYRACSSN
ncbi:MAG: hypothetical protein WD052_04285 [Bacteroidales bacterium]